MATTYLEAGAGVGSRLSGVVAVEDGSARKVGFGENETGQAAHVGIVLTEGGASVLQRLVLGGGHEGSLSSSHNVKSMLLHGAANFNASNDQ